ncbi:sensor histidine kinase [Streptomyces sp. NPDC053427]|uniref:sensor histidine kinase n=1 Tax=Streptomyces sp. NPDC053427 TaxID=3365701 RepID=UPI0037CE8A8B
MTAAKARSWSGCVLYPVALFLLLGGAPHAPHTVHAIGALLATSLLVGVLRHAPLIALALTLVGSTMVVVFTYGYPQSASVSYQSRFLSYLAVDLVLGVIIASRTRRTSLIAAAVTFVVQFTAITGLSHGPFALIGTSVIALLAMVTSCTVGLLIRERREHAVAWRSQALADAVTAERLRIARELHDMVAHSIGIIAIQAGVGKRVIETQPAEARNALDAIEATSRETLSGLRRTLVALRRTHPGEDAEETPLAPSPCLTDIDRLAATTTEAGVRVDVHWSGERRQLPPELELSAYRIVQEAVTNVVRHASAGHCQVTIAYKEDELSIEIVDNGRGTPVSTTGRGFGITGMRERVRLLHGCFSAGPQPEGGFRVAAELPTPERVTDVAAAR